MSFSGTHLVVVFGAPGTGKTTLLKLLLERNSDARCPVRFAIIDEPTSRPDIAALLQKMYEETAADIAAGRSVAAQVQTRIMEARIEGYVNFMDTRMAEERQAAMRDKKKALVVVCDGHVLTDDRLYVQSKFDAGQISMAELRAYTAHKSALLSTVAHTFAEPSVFCQLMIGDDHSGAKHHYRVCAQRNNSTERSVPPAVFARLARYADQTRRALSVSNSISGAVCWMNTDSMSIEAVGDAFVALFASPTSTGTTVPNKEVVFFEAQTTDVAIECP